MNAIPVCIQCGHRHHSCGECADHAWTDICSYNAGADCPITREAASAQHRFHSQQLNSLAYTMAVHLDLVTPPAPYLGDPTILLAQVLTNVAAIKNQAQRLQNELGQRDLLIRRAVESGDDAYNILVKDETWDRWALEAPALRVAEEWCTLASAAPTEPGLAV